MRTPAQRAARRAQKKRARERKRQKKQLTAELNGMSSYMGYRSGGARRWMRLNED